MLKERLGLEAALIPGGGGEFEVKKDGELIYSKRATGEFPDDAALVASLK